MATFAVRILQIDSAEPHPKADKLTINRIGGYIAVSNLKDMSKTNKDPSAWRYQTGDLVAYIPEGALMPEWLLRELNMWNDDAGKGFLAGPDGNRVHAVTLRGVLSQGVLMPAVVEMGTENWGGYVQIVIQGEHQGYVLNTWDEPQTREEAIAEVLGRDVAPLLGIRKYQPQIPVELLGDVVAIHGDTLPYDIENIKDKRAEGALSDGDKVVMREKLHGMFLEVGVVPGLSNAQLRDDSFCTSKGLADSGMAFANRRPIKYGFFARLLNACLRMFGGTIPEYEDIPISESNMYVQVAEQFEIAKRIKQLWRNVLADDKTPIYVMGEIYGMTQQDLKYGMTEKSFAVFDVYIGVPGHGYYVDALGLEDICKHLDLPMVPEIYSGPFSRTVLDEHTNGKTVAGNGAHIREGVIIRPYVERHHDGIGRVILKSVSPAYLSRKDGTEFS